MPEKSDIPPVIQTLLDDVAVAMKSAPTSSWYTRLAQTIAAATRGAPKRSASVALVAAAVIGLIVIPALGGGRTAIAEAEVLKRAAAALDQPSTILSVQVREYGDDELCVADGPSPSTMCVGSRATGSTGISADPANDTLNYSSDEWLTTGGVVDHTIYGNGDETVAASDVEGHRWYTAYNASDNSVWTLSPAGSPNPPPTTNTSAPPNTSPPTQPLGILGLLMLASNGSDASSPSVFEALYQEAQDGQQSTQGPAVITPQFVGSTTIGNEPVYELRFDVHFTSNPYANDKCGASTCPAPPDQAVLAYIDSQTFMPVRTVLMTFDASGQTGAGATATVVRLTTFDVQSLPNTAANQTLLQMSPHPTATVSQSTYLVAPAASTGASGTTGSTSQSATTGASGTAN